MPTVPGPAPAQRGGGNRQPANPADRTGKPGDTLTPLRLAQLWLKHGGSKSAVPMAVAIALAESGGQNIQSKPNRDGSVDRGPWQINSIHGAQSDLNVDNNAAAAVAISKNGTDWTPWTTFKNGAYKSHLATGNAQVDPSSGGGVFDPAIDAGASVVNTATSVGDFLGKLSSPTTWLHIGLVVGGAICLILALVFIGMQFSEKLPLDKIPPIIPV